MLKRLGDHFRHNIVGYVGIFLALGGTTYAATGGNFILGQSNSATSTTGLSAGTTGPALRVTNTSTGAAGSFNAAAGHPALAVNTAAKVSKLNADLLDGKDITNWRVQGFQTLSGPLPISVQHANAAGDNILVMASGSGYRSSANKTTGLIGMQLKVDGISIGAPAEVFTNEANSHKAFVSVYTEIGITSAGSHTYSLEALSDPSCGTSDTTDTLCTTTDSSDRFSIGFVEVPAP